MFRIALLVNENEVAHSAFADTLGVLKRPGALGDQKLNTYRFFAFDKYNIYRMFLRDGENYLTSFDSLIIATNATNNIEVLQALRNNASLVEEFLRTGRGILVCSQKKLSQKFGEDARITGFLPERYEYGLYDRPESSSAEGVITELVPSDPLFSYPNVVTDELIEHRCTNNSFMAHKYRSHIVPRHPSQFITLLVDSQAPPVPESLRASLDPSRAVMLRTGSTTERLVVTSMALDWAGHEELLENILVYITEGTSQIAVLRRRDSNTDKAMDAYVVRARVAKTPVREYFDVEPDLVAHLKHRTLIVSPAFSITEVEQMWSALVSSGEKSADLYHVTPDTLTDGFQLWQRSSSSALDRVSAAAGAWLARSFFPTLWGKSIWTYNYVLPMMIELGIDHRPYLPSIFTDICKHVPKTSAPLASYDNVINATSQMLEVVGTAILPTGFTPDGCESALTPRELYEGCAGWIVKKLTGGSTHSLRDRLYMVNALSRVSYLDKLDGEASSEVFKSARDTRNSYRASHYIDCETVELTQVLELTAGLGAEGRSLGTFNSELSSIITVLRTRQSSDGEWRNVNETAEVTLALLRLRQRHKQLASNKELAETIVKGVERLLHNYDARLGSWSDDINATAKAAHALALFDKQSGLSFDNFFAEIRAKTGFRLESEALEASLNHEGELLATLFRREAELAERAAHVAAAQRQLRTAKKRLRRYRVFTFGASVIALISGSALTLMFGILFVSYKTVAKELVGNWRDYIISGFVGIILTLVFMGIYSVTKGKILREDS